MVRRTNVNALWIILLILAICITSCSPDKNDKIGVDTEKQDSDAKSELPEIVLQTGHTGYINDFVFDPSGEILVTGASDGTMRIWNVKKDLLLRILRIQIAVNALAINPGGNLLASGLSDGNIVIWDIDTGKVAKKLDGYNSGVESMAFLDDGIHLATIGFDDRNYTLRVWNVKTGKQIRSVDIQSSSRVFSYDGKFVAVSGYDDEGYDEIHVIDVTSGKVLNRFENDSYSNYTSMAISYDNKMLATSAMTRVMPLPRHNNMLLIRDLQTGSLVKKLPWEKDYLGCLGFSPDGKTLAANSGNREFVLFDVATGKPVKTIETSNQEKNLFSPDGRTLAMVWQSGIYLYNSETMERIEKLDFQGPLFLSRDTGDTNDILSAYEQRHHGENTDTFSYEWNLETGTVETISKSFFHTYQKNSEQYRMFPDKGIKVAVDKKGTLAVFQYESGKRINTLLEGRYIAGTAFSRDGNLIASHHCFDKENVCVDEKLTIWDINSGKRLHNISIKSKPLNAASAGMAISFLPDSSKLITMGYSDNKIDVWSLKDGTLLFTLNNKNNNYQHFFSSDGKFLFLHGRLSLSINGAIPSDNYEIWNLETGKQVLYVNADEKFDLKSESAHTYMRLSPDSQTLGVGWIFSDKNSFLAQGKLKIIEFVDVSTGKTARTLNVDSDDIEYFVFHPNGRQIITSGRNGIDFRNIDTGDVVTRLDSRHYAINYLDTCCDGHILFGGTGEGDLVLWSMDTGKELVKLYMFSAGEWLVTDSNGHFDCSGCDKKNPEGGMKYIKWRIDNTVYPANEFFDKYFKPGLLTDIMKNAS